jgi:plasmid stabilization system protein ParE
MVKKYHVVLLPQAVYSLRQITDFLRRRRSEEVAKYVRKNILDKIRKLSKLPHTHEVVEEISKGTITYHRSLQWSYRIIFTIYEDELRVEVVDIDHGADDPQILLEKFS